MAIGAAVARRAGRSDDARAGEVFRYAFAVTLSVVIAQAINWPINFLHPVLVITLMTMPAPTLKESLADVGYAIVAASIGASFTLVFMAYPLAFIVAFPLLVFLTLYGLLKGVPLLLCLFMVLGLLIMPVVATVHDFVPLVVAESFVLSTVLTVLVVQISFGLFPQRPGMTTFGLASPSYQTGYSAEAAGVAATATIVLAPALIVFVSLEWTPAVVTLIYMFVIALNGSLADTEYATKKYLKANAVAGLGALVFYGFLVVVPEIYFLAVLVLFTVLLFGSKIFSDDPYAAYYNSALTGLVILVCSSMGPGADVGANSILRIFYIFAAGIYAILAFPLAHWLASRLIRSESRY